MNKDKVINLLDDSDICFLGYVRNGCRDLIAMGLSRLHEAQEELSKSDWTPVMKELPPLEESVLVTSEFDTDDIYFSHRTERKDVIVDKNRFATYKDAKPITHWRKIDKLDVQH